jgi:hypothetical protein
MKQRLFLRGAQWFCFGLGLASAFSVHYSAYNEFVNVGIVIMWINMSIEKKSCHAN